jgi:MFS family permease
MRRFLVVLGWFTLARASETFIVLLGHERGMSAPALLVLWAALGLAKAVTATHGGRLADRLGRLAPIGVSWGALAVSFALLAVLPGQPALWLVAIGYGLGVGFGEGAERALVGDFASARERGTAFGWYNFVVGLCAIPSGLLFGGLWHAFGAASAFATAAAVAAVAVLLLWIWARPSAGAR